MVKNLHPSLLVLFHVRNEAVEFMDSVNFFDRCQLVLGQSALEKALVNPGLQNAGGLHELVEDLVKDLVAVHFDLNQSQREQDLMVLQEASRHTVQDFEEEFVGEHFPSQLVVRWRDFVEFLTLLDDCEEDVHEELERVLVEIVNGRHAVQREEDPGRFVGQWGVLLSDLLDLLHVFVGCCDLFGDFFRLGLESIESLDQLVVLQQVALRLVELVQQLVF